jgi:geranylgeranyl pyrophosphate synthase
MSPTAPKILRGPGRNEPPIARHLDDEFARMTGADASALRTTVWQRVLLAPAHEILARPGKSFRARLVEAAFTLVQPEAEVPSNLGFLVEVLHAASLIVDDIEDDSLTRRGRPALHKMFGLSRALNTANWMYFWPFDALACLGLPAAGELELHRRMARTMLDCHRGQALDLGLTVGDVPQSEVTAVVAELASLKTGALMELAAVVGGIAAGAGDTQVVALAHFGRHLGVGLQMLDDLGNLTSRREPGKRHEDLHHGRVTWPWAWAATALDEISYAKLQAGARAVCEDGADGSAEALAGQLLALAGPDRRAMIGDQLAICLEDLEAVFGPSDATAMLRAEIARLEASYG